MIGKNTSFQLFTGVLRVPISFVKPAYFITPSGAAE
jgi:hypothetical protein